MAFATQLERADTLETTNLNTGAPVLYSTGLSSRLALKVATHRRLGRPYATAVRCESCDRHHMLKRRNDPDFDPGSETPPKWRR